jgi:cyclopropane-fatty-acyl-phospholipid synthase
MRYKSTMNRLDRYARSRITRLFAGADVVPDGERAWDPQINSPEVFRRILLQGSLGLGESYVDGLWDCAQLDELFFRLMRASLDRTPGVGLTLLARVMRARLLNWQSRARARRLAHYDLGNRLFERMLDPRMIYTCAYWQDCDDLAAAQEAKLDLVCRKLRLKRGMRVLDIGCGWGGFMQYAAERYGVSCVGVTISPAQLELGRARCAGLPIEFRLQDYREIEGRFDAIASIGMFEAVGRRNYREFMQVCRRSLRHDGLLLLHTIGARSASALDAADPWLSTYIFSEGELPGTTQIAAAADGLFTLEDWHNFGADYDRTLMAWHGRFLAAWPELRADYDERFFRLWTYYLLCCAGLFRARSTQLWQIVFARRGALAGYRRP